MNGFYHGLEKGLKTAHLHQRRSWTAERLDSEDGKNGGGVAGKKDTRPDFGLPGEGSQGLPNRQGFPVAEGFPAPDGMVFRLRANLVVRDTRAG